ncbi:hypothetical protein M9Y10_027986 [Tritrichomonas musculus]|uniref:Anaphase-promoting complex subunit 4-like WD40 domain-containing protein n=1 Tax=Tritrichomonas musculus TaxID=1915356 RepID=A0ABR2KIU5_9EUKA
MSKYLEPSKSKTAWSATQENSDVTSMQFSPNGKSLAIGCFNGNVYIRNSLESRLMYRIQAVSSESPITSVKWHPFVANSIIATSASGFITSWHTETGQRLWSLQEENNSINSFDLSPNGQFFCTAGGDCVVRNYSLTTKQLINEMKTRSYIKGEVSGHENRIFSVVYVDQHTIASSGWDNTVIIWDARSGDVVRSIFGPQVCGESMVALSDNIIITGSWRDEDQLQFWDVGTGKNLSTTSINFGDEPLQVYSLSLSKDKRIVGCSGSNLNAAAFYRTSDYKFLAETEKFSDCPNVIALTNDTYAIGLANSTVYCDSMMFDLI